MKKRLFSIIILFIVLPFALFSQEKDADHFRFVDVGIGSGYEHGALNLAFTNGLESVIATFIDYNLYFDKSDLLFHEINIKLGPYYQFNKYSYFAVSSGISYIFNSSKSQLKDTYASDSHLPVSNYNNNYMLNIPIQVKLNTAVYKGFCIGFKGTYNKMIKKSINDTQSILMYVSMGF